MQNTIKMRDMLTPVFGVSWSIIIGVIVGIIQVKTGFAFYSLMLWFVIPIGAFLTGFIASGGFYFGAKLLHQKPAGGVLINLVITSITAFLVIHYIPYFMLEIDNVRIKDSVSFWQYLDWDIKHTSISFRRVDSAISELGSFWGYAFALLQLIGFSVGGLAVFGFLSQNPYCNKCNRYLKRISKKERYSDDGEDINKKFQFFLALVGDKKYNDAVNYHAEKMGDEKLGKNYLNSKLITSFCSTCGINHISFVISKLNNGDWKAINETAFNMYIDNKLYKNQDERIISGK